MAEPDRYWFPAKRYGWGWGPPVTWQGWLVLAASLLLVLLGAFLFPPAKNALAFIACTAVVCAALVGICLVKGEPPRWRWGGK